MKHLRFLLPCLITLISFSMSAQTSVLSSHSLPIDEDRYGEIKGSPYLFKDPMKANLINKKGELIKGVMLNYNGYDHGIEVFKNGRFTIIDETQYPKIVVTKHGLKNNVDGEMILIPSPQKSAAKGMYLQEIYASPTLSLFKKFRVAKKENEINTPGKIVVQQRFTKYEDYFISKDGELIGVKDKLDDFAKVLGYKKELKAFCKKTKNKFKSDQDLKELLEYYDTL